jgi:poly(hydroxyalkanoate) depolymerase family esterase
MNAFHPDMAEATRLTREGRLTEATSLLQRLLHGTADAGPAPQPAPSPDIPSDSARLHMPDALRKLVDRVKGLGAGLGLGERAKPAPAPEGGGRFVEASFTNGAGTRSYKLYIPAGYHGQTVPLVVMLHGCTQSPDDFAAGTGMNALAEEHGFLVLYPAQAQSANAQRCWNWFIPTDQQRDTGEPSLIAGITRRVMVEHAVDPRRVYVAGLSAGGAQAAIMGIAYPEFYAAVGVHSGLAAGAAKDLPSALAAMKNGESMSPTDGASRPLVPTIVFHGDQDRTVSPRNGDRVVAQALAGAAGLRTEHEQGQVEGGHGYSRTLYRNDKGATVLERWQVHGAGHAWAGGSEAGTYTDPRGPSASREMLRFFLANPARAA